MFGGQIDGGNNALDGDPFGLAGSYTFPLSHGSGMQLDGLVARLDGETVAGAGVHLFARDPSKGLIGVVGSYTSIGRDGANVPDQEVGLAGAEGELYLNEFTLAASLGHQFGDNVDDGAVGSLDLGWYANDNLMLGIGAAATPDVNKMAIASIEYQPAIEGFSGLSVFADAAFGDDDYSSVMVGLRYYFGGKKSLKDRHRRDDPISNLPLYSLQRGSSTGGY